MNDKMWEKPVMIHGYILQRTCHACPEQYDVFAGEHLVAYLRLRHGNFYAACPDVGGDVVYEASPYGDGIFNKEERVGYLTQAILAIQEYYLNREWDKEDNWV
jgi:hypothetical protein